MDNYIFSFLNSFAGRWEALDAVAVFFAGYFEYVLIFCFLLFLAKDFKKYWPMVIRAFGAAVLARFIISEIIRWLWERPRPFAENSVNLLIQHPATASFPSGHAAFYFAIATVIFLYYKKIYPVTKRSFWCGVGLLFFLAAFLISFARVFGGIHWPSDILAGALVGILSGWLVVKLSNKKWPSS